METEKLESAILAHLHNIALTKRALLEVAINIADEYPTESRLLLSTITGLTRSADTLLGDTNVL